VIASDLPAVRDVIQHGKTGHLVMAADSAALALSIKVLLNNTTQRQAHSVQALVMVRYRFDWDSVAQRYQNCLQSKLCLAPTTEAVHAN
jgi:glycosyltransferase involved in cell wall biosynthesis